MNATHCIPWDVNCTVCNPGKFKPIPGFRMPPPDVLEQITEQNDHAYVKMIAPEHVLTDLVAKAKAVRHKEDWRTRLADGDEEMAAYFDVLPPLDVLRLVREIRDLRDAVVKATGDFPVENYHYDPDFTEIPEGWGPMTDVDRDTHIRLAERHRGKDTANWSWVKTYMRYEATLRAADKRVYEQGQRLVEATDLIQMLKGELTNDMVLFTGMQEHVDAANREVETLLQSMAAEVVKAQLEVARLKNLEAIATVERGIHGGFHEGGLLAVGQALIDRAQRITTLEEEKKDLLELAREAIRLNQSTISSGTAFSAIVKQATLLLEQHS